jgi:hypothetical protein
MRLAPCRAGETLKELKGGELEDPETAIVRKALISGRFALTCKRRILDWP